MKGPQAAMMVCLLNVGVLALGGGTAYLLFTSSSRDIGKVLNEKPEVAAKATEWRDAFKAGSETSLDGFGATRLSPIKRPEKIVVPVGTGPVEVVKLTDDELKAELTKWIASKFTLKRVVHSTIAADNCAFMIASELDKAAPLVFVSNGVHFPTYFGKHDNLSLRALAKYDITVRIESDGVTFHAPSISEPTKFFDVRVEFAASAFSSALGQPGASKRTDRLRDTDEGKRPGDTPGVPGVKEPPAGGSSYNSQTDTWTLGAKDFETLKSTDISKAVRVAVGPDGKAYGLELTDDVDEKHILAQRGGKKGDVIKAINGKAVRSLAEVRTLISKEVDAGVTTFVVSYERDGIAGVKTFKK